MAATSKLACPHCGATHNLAHLVPAGKRVRCAGCRNAFRVPARKDHLPAVAVPVAVGVAPPPAPDHHEPEVPQTGQVNLGRLVLALCGMLFYLTGGAALGFYCFTLNSEKGTPVQAGPGPEQTKDQDPSVPVPPVAHAPGSPASMNAKQQKAVDDAIVKGVWFLKKTQHANGSWDETLPTGYAALGGLTLLECGVFTADPVVQKCATCVRDQAVQLTNNYDNYQRALAILFLDRLGDKKDNELIQYLALCLIAGQQPTDGGWTYSSPVLDKGLIQGSGSSTQLAQLVKQLNDQKQSLDDWRKTALKGAAFDVTTWDNSNTQFVILGLWAAQRHGVPIDRSIALAEKHFRTRQLHGQNGAALADPTGNNLNLDGSWYYNTTGNSGSWPSMTCAGLLGLAMAHGTTKDPKEKKQKPLDDPAIKQGLAMLAREIGRQDEKRVPDYYFLWSLERVGVLYNLPKIDGKDWYAWGVPILLPRQLDDGSWTNGGYYGNNPTLDTCFVLLFLKRANLVKDLTSKLQLLENSK